MISQGAWSETVGRSSCFVDKLNNCDSSSRASHRHPGRGSVPLGTRKLGFSPQRPLASARKRAWPSSDNFGGGWPRGRRPLGCVLCLLSVALQKVGAPAARAGERKEIDSPREGWACESKPVVVLPVNCGPLGRSGRRLPAREARCRSAREGWVFLGKARRRRPAFSRPSGCRSGAARHTRAGLFSAEWPVRHPLGVPGGNATEDRSHGN